MAAAAAAALTADAPRPPWPATAGWLAAVAEDGMLLTIARPQNGQTLKKLLNHFRSSHSSQVSRN
jgi:hypothetical protein